MGIIAHNKGYIYTLLSPMFRFKSNVVLPYSLEREDVLLTKGCGEVEITFNVTNDLPAPSFSYHQNFEFCFGDWGADSNVN